MAGCELKFSARVEQIDSIEDITHSNEPLDDYILENLRLLRKELINKEACNKLQDLNREIAVVQLRQLEDELWSNWDFINIGGKNIVKLVYLIQTIFYGDKNFNCWKSDWVWWQFTRDNIRLFQRRYMGWGNWIPGPKTIKKIIEIFWTKSKSELKSESVVEVRGEITMPDPVPKTNKKISMPDLVPIKKSKEKIEWKLVKFDTIPELKDFLDTTNASIKKTIEENPGKSLEEIAKENPTFRNELIWYIFGWENRQITIDDYFRQTTENVIDSAISWLDSLWCTPTEKTKWLSEMFTFFMIWDSFLSRSKIEKLGRQNGIKYGKFFLKKQDASKRQNYEKFLRSIFIDGDPVKWVKLELINQKRVDILRRLVEKWVSPDVFQFHTPLWHAHWWNKSAHIQYSKNPQFEVEAFDSIMNSALKEAWVKFNYKATKIRTTGFWWMKASRDVFTNDNLKWLSLNPVSTTRIFDTKWAKGNEIVSDLWSHWKTQTDWAKRCEPILHTQSKFTEEFSKSKDFFQKLANSFFETWNSK